MDTDITIQDIQQLQREAGEAENIQRLRAIAAERRVRELEAEIAAKLRGILGEKTAQTQRS